MAAQVTRLLVNVSEESLELLQSQADAVRRTPEDIAAIRLRQGLTLPVTGRALVLSGDDLDTLERILGGGSLLNSGDLRKKVERLAGISFLHLRLPFTPNQLELLAEKAARNGLTVEQLAERTAPRMYAQFFDLVGV
jgi:hypothetical protein